MTRPWRYVAIAVSAWLVGLAWALSSPVGSSPDDDYHLASIYCATGDEGLCQDLDGDGPGTSVAVPGGALGMGCYAFKSEVSGACMKPDEGEAEVTDHYNNEGQYPPTFYAAMSWLAGPDVVRSVLVMRLAALTVALFGLGLAAFAAPTLRDGQLVGWAVAAIPLGLFIVPSTNPSGWGIAGVAAMWPAGYALLHAGTPRTVVLGTAATGVAALLASARGDTAGIAMGVLMLVVLAFARARDVLVPALIAVGVAVALGLTFITSGQSEALETGLSGAETASGTTLLLENLGEVPGIWAGAFGVEWGLGWLDTEMPALSWLPALSGAAAIFVIGVAAVRWRRGFVLAALGAVLYAYPLIMLQLSGAVAGTQFQPRYVLPVVFVLLGVALSPVEGKPIVLTAPQRWLLTVGAAVAASIGLRAELRRYVTGDDIISANLNASAEWSYGGWANPMAVWVLGSLASAALFYLVFRLLASVPSSDSEPDQAGAAEPLAAPDSRVPEG